MGFWQPVQTKQGGCQSPPREFWIQNSPRGFSHPAQIGGFLSMNSSQFSTKTFLPRQLETQDSQHTLLIQDDFSRSHLRVEWLQELAGLLFGKLLYWNVQLTTRFIALKLQFSRDMLLVHLLVNELWNKSYWCSKDSERQRRKLPLT